MKAIWIFFIVSRFGVPTPQVGGHLELKRQTQSVVLQVEYYETN